MDLDKTLDLEQLEVDGTLGHINEAVIMLHPQCSDPKKLVEDGETAIAYLATNPDFEFEEHVCCFYCGEDYADENPAAKIIPCKTCDQGLCDSCIKDVGCLCSRKDDEEVVIDSFVPKPGQVKTTTFSKQQRMKVMKGAEKLEQQDDAMWSTLTGKSNMMNPLKKCLLAVIVFSHLFTGAIGHTTTFVDPGWKAEKCSKEMIDNLNQTVEEQDPSLIYIHVPFQDAGENNKSYCRLKQFAEDQTKAGKTCITMDVRHTKGSCSRY